MYLWGRVELERFLSRSVNSSQNCLNDKFQNILKEKFVLDFQPFQVKCKLMIENWKRKIRTQTKMEFNSEVNWKFLV